MSTESKETPTVDPTATIEAEKAKAKAAEEAKAEAEAKIEAQKAEQAALDKIKVEREAEQKKLTDTHTAALEAQGIQSVPIPGAIAPEPEKPKDVSKRWKTIESLNAGAEVLQVMDVGSGVVMRSIMDVNGAVSQAMILLPDYQVVGPENIIRHI